MADFFCGGGTTLAVAQQLGRRWVGCDISRVAVALTADRVSRIISPNREDSKISKRISAEAGSNQLFSDSAGGGKAQKKSSNIFPLPQTGLTVEHWGIYEINRLTELSKEDFRAFVLACYGAKKWTGADPHIHGVKSQELLWVGSPMEEDAIVASDVKHFADAAIKARKPEERDGLMIGWTVDPKAKIYAQKLMALGHENLIQFIKLRLWPLTGQELNEHVIKKNNKYRDFFAFIFPPEIPRIGIQRIGGKKYQFDVSEARSMNSGGNIINVQWDFDFKDGIFSATKGYELCHKENKQSGEAGFTGVSVVEYDFDQLDKGAEIMIACRVQDDLGGEGMRALKLRVE